MRTTSMQTILRRSVLTLPPPLENIWIFIGFCPYLPYSQNISQDTSHLSVKVLILNYSGKTFLCLSLMITPIFPSVTGASIHAPVQKNSPYVHMDRQSIYDTRKQKHPHSPTCQIMNHAPRDPILCRIILNPSRTWPGSTLFLRLSSWHLCICHN